MPHSHQLMTHIVAGYPSLEESEKIATTMLESGVDFLEIQIPFTDPIGDGPTITKACRDSIASGIKVADCFSLMGSLRKKINIPLLFMTYYNIIFNYGVDNFCAKAKEVGAYGLIVPDMPFDEEPHEHFIKAAHKCDLKIIWVISPITPAHRLAKIGTLAEGFVYCVAGFGTTGTKQNKAGELQDYLEKVREFIKVPLAVGFGITSREEIAEVGKAADIVVVGSQIIKLYQEENGLEKIKALTK